MANRGKNIVTGQTMLEKNMSKILPETALKLTALKLETKPFAPQFRLSAGDIKVQSPDKVQITPSTLPEMDATIDGQSEELLDGSKNGSKFENTQLEMNKDIPRSSDDISKSQKTSRQRRDQKRRRENVKKKKQAQRSNALQDSKNAEKFLTDVVFHLIAAWSFDGDLHPEVPSEIAKECSLIMIKEWSLIMIKSLQPFIEKVANENQEPISLENLTTAVVKSLVSALNKKHQA